MKVSSPLRNCLSCALYLRCKDARKSVLFSCDRYTTGKEGSQDSMRRLFDAVELDMPDTGLMVPNQSLNLSVPGLSDDFDIYSLIDDAINSKSIVSPDLRLNDGDFKLANNFLEFCISDQGLKTKPFVAQALIGIKLFGEYCYRCSDLDYFDNYNVKDSLSKLQTKIALLNHGKCPHCKRTQDHYYAKQKLPLYSEIAVAAGQRCVVGNTHILTADGMMRIEEYASKKPYGFSKFHLDVHNGNKFETTSDFYRARPERVYRMTISNGQWLEGTGDHPVKQFQRGFKRLSDTKVGDLIPLQINQQVFGNKYLYFEDVLAESQAYADKVLDEAHGRDKHKYVHTAFKKYRGVICTDMYTVLGIWVAEGRGGFISNDDQTLLDFCYRTLTKYINSRYIIRGRRGIKIRGFRGRCFLATLLGITEKQLWSGSAKKEIPLAVRQASKENVCAFLRGMFEGDGGVVRSQVRHKIKYSVSYASISKQLIMDLSAVMNNLGIAHKIRKRMSWATNGTENQVSKPYWSLGFRNFYMTRFESQIGFMSERKNRKLRQAIEHHEQKTNAVPSWHENLNCIKQQVLKTLDRFSAELKQHSLPHWERSESQAHRHRFRKTTTTMGLGTVYGRNSGRLGFALRKLRRDPSRALTKEKLYKLCSNALRYTAYMSEQTKFEFEEYIKLCNPDIILTRVKKIGLTSKHVETYDFTLPETHRFVTGGIISHNSGKSAVVAMISAYILHRMLKLQNPNEVYGLARSNVFHGTFVALTYAQAKDTLWDPFYGNLLESPWFQGYHQLLHEHHERTGEELAKLNDTFVTYKHRRLVIYPAGPDKRTLRGRTRWLAAIDEIGWFDNSADTSKVKMSANEVYIALERSLLTVRAAAQNMWARGFTEIPTGYFLNVSSPSSVRDKVMELVRKAQGSRKILGLIRPTWEMNPNVTKKHLAEEFKADPVAAMRDYGAQPPLSSNAFLTNGLITGVIGEKSNGIVLQHKTKTSKKSGDTMRYATITKVRRTGKPSCLALDAGYVNNSFAFALGHLEDHKFPQIDIVGEIMPLPGMRLNFSRIYEEVIVPLVDARNVQLVAADRWNSIKILSDIEEDEEVETRQYSLKYADMRLFKDYIENKQIILPDPKRNLDEIVKYNQSNYPQCFKDDPIGHFYLQLLTVQDTGSSVVKGDQLTDDMVRATMLCVRMLLDDDHAELWTNDRVDTSAQIDVHTIAVQKGYSGGGGSASGAVNPNGSALGIRRSRQG